MSEQRSNAVLARVREYRRASRAIVNTERASVARRCLGLLELGDMARKESDLTIRTWAERAIWEEARTFLGMDDERPALPPEPFEHRQRRLRSQGEATCTRCLSRICSDDDLSRFATLRREAAEQRRVRDGAVT